LLSRVRFPQHRLAEAKTLWAEQYNDHGKVVLCAASTPLHPHVEKRFQQRQEL
jgi:hypothetical protein